MRNFYHWLLMLQKRASLEDDDLLASCFCEGLWADLCCVVETLPNSTTIAKLKGCASKYESGLCTAKPVCVVAVLLTVEERSAVQEVHEEMRDLHKDLHDVVVWVCSGLACRPARPMAEVQCYHC